MITITDTTTGQDLHCKCTDLASARHYIARLQAAATTAHPAHDYRTTATIGPACPLPTRQAQQAA